MAHAALAKNLGFPVTVKPLKGNKGVAVAPDLQNYGGRRTGV